MKITTSVRDGFEVLALENEILSASVVPALGGKIRSLRDKCAGFEFLFQNPRPRYLPRRRGASFQDYDASGFDDAFPNVDPSETEFSGRSLSFPDHGELWTAPMRAEVADGGVRLCTRGGVFAYDYEKRVRLNENSLALDFAITNRESIPMPCLWTMHCLVNVDPDTEFLLPPGADEAENLFPGPVLGAPGRMKVAETPALTRVPAPGSDVMFKYYLTEPVREGVCGYAYPSRGRTLRVRYDPEKLPYLGLWCTMGGYRGDCNAALEPTTGYYDSIPRALETGRVRMLAPGERFEFSLTLSSESSDSRDHASPRPRSRSAAGGRPVPERIHRRQIPGASTEAAAPRGTARP